MKKLALAFLIFIMAAGLAAADKFGDYSGPVNDLAGVLDRDEARELEAKILRYRDSTRNEIGVLIISSLEDRPLEDFAHDVFKQWGIGEKEKDNGVLFLVAIDDKKARIEVGYGLEAELTDLECGRLVSRNSSMADNFRGGDYGAGVNAVVDGIIEGIGGEYNPRKKDERADKILGLLFPMLFIGLFILIAALKRKGIKRRGFGGPFWGGFGGGFGGRSSGGGGGGFSFGGGSSGGGGASGGW